MATVPPHHTQPCVGAALPPRAPSPAALCSRSLHAGSGIGHVSSVTTGLLIAGGGG